MSKHGPWQASLWNFIWGEGYFCKFWVITSIYFHWSQQTMLTILLQLTLQIHRVCMWRDIKTLPRSQEFLNPPLQVLKFLELPLNMALQISCNFWLLQDNEDSAVLHDASHHDQYHLAATRVLSLVSLHLMDDNHLPYSLLNYTKFIHDVYGRSLIDLSKAEAVVDRGKILGCTDLF